MAERMSLILGASALALAASAVAQPAGPQPRLMDPTRPPSVAPAGAREASGVPGGAPRLQSVLISPGRNLAVIDGRTVLLGGKFDEATLVQIAETHVTLKQGNELKTLELYPGFVRKAPGQDQSAVRKKGNL